MGMAETTAPVGDGVVFNDLNQGATAYAPITAPIQANNTPEDIRAVFARPYRAKSYTWTSVSAADGFTPYSYLGSNPEWSEKLKHYTGFRGNAHVRVVMSGSPFHFGRLAVGTLPCQSGSIEGAFLGRNDVSYYTNPNGVMSTPHILCDPSSTSPMELVVPFIYPNPYLNLNGRNGTARFTTLATVSYVPIVALSTANAAAPTNVTVTFYVYFTEVELVGMTPSTVILTARDVRVKEQLSKGPVTRVSSAVAAVATTLKDVPIIGGFASGVATISGAVADVAALFGWSRPSLNAHPVTIVKRTDGASMSNSIGPTTALKMTHDPLQGLSTDPSTYGGDREDNMSYAYIARQWGYMHKFSWTDTSAAGTLLETLMVAPTVGPMIYSDGISNTYIVVPPVTHLALANAYWRGSLEYRIVLVASPMMRGRLSVRHYPFATATTTPVGFGGVTSQTCNIEVGSDTVMDITVPWTCDADVLPVRLGRANGAGTASNTIDNVNLTTRTSNGFLVIEVLSPLVGQYSPLTATVMVYIRGGPDFQVLEPSSAILSNTPSPLSFLASRDATIEGAANDPVQCEIGQQTFALANVAERHTGEQIFSVRALLKRFEYVAYMQYIASAASATSGFYTIVVRMNPPGFDDVGKTGVSDGAISNYAWYSRCYTGCRGGTRYRIVNDKVPPVGGAVFNKLNDVVYVRRLPAMYGANTTYLTVNRLTVGVADSTPFKLAGQTFASTMGGIETFTDGLAEFELPDSSDTLYRATTYPYFYAATANNPAEAATCAGALVTANVINDFVSATLYPTRARLFYAAADDFTFTHYIGPPGINFGV